MRPVNRGNPAAYPNYPNVPIPWDIQHSINFLFSAMRLKRWTGKSFVEHTLSQINGIISDLKQNRDIDFVQDQTLRAPANISMFELQEKEESLEESLNDGYMHGADDATMLGIAQKLVFNLLVQIELYQAAVKPHKRRIAATYALARGDLINNIGQYCSYCEMPLAASLAVEHMLPKAWFPRVSVNWDNFLLACPICNSIKKDTPTVQDGSNAIDRQANPKPTWTDYAQAAFGLYVWPSDAAGYPSFFTQFHYALTLVLYNSDQSIFDNYSLTPQHLLGMIGGRRMILAPPDDSGYIKATFFPLLFEILGANALAVAAFLGGITASQAITNNNIGAVPAPLVQAFSNMPATPEMLGDRGQYPIVFGVAPNVTIAPQQANEWRLDQRDYYMLSKAGRITVRDMNGTQLFQSSNAQGEINALLNSLANNILPDSISAALRIDNFGRTINIVQAGQDATRNTFVIEVVRSYRIRNEAGIIRCYAEQTYPVELWLKGTTARSQLTIEKIKLNKNAPNDPKNADRRMARRVKAYFSAIDALYNLSDAQNLGGTLPADVLAMVRENAISTGFWSVWRHVIETYMSNSPQKVAILAAINGGFAGTR